MKQPVYTEILSTGRYLFIFEDNEKQIIAISYLGKYYCFGTTIDMIQYMKGDHKVRHVVLDDKDFKEFITNLFE